jgi:hypothetical protein
MDKRILIGGALGLFLLSRSKRAQAAFATPRSLGPVYGPELPPGMQNPAPAPTAPVTPEAASAPARELALSRKAGVPIAILRAIGAMESSKNPPPASGWPAGKGAGEPFQWGGPKVMRFEPHVFNRKVPSEPMPCTRNGMTCAAAKAADKGSASTVSSEVRWPAFQRAYAKNPRAAVESTSWGRYQVMGSNFLDALYAGNPAALIKAWVDADWETAEDMSDQYLVEWFIQRPDVVRYANMPLDKIIHYGGKNRTVAEVIGRRYNGRYSYGPKMAEQYAAQVAAGAPTALV